MEEPAILLKVGKHEAIPELPSNISAVAKDFLMQCFIRNKDARPSAAQLLNHPFITRMNELLVSPVIKQVEKKDVGRRCRSLSDVEPEILARHRRDATKSIGKIFKTETKIEGFRRIELYRPKANESSRKCEEYP
jgi:serine/threonine protein kinase